MDLTMDASIDKIVEEAVKSANTKIEEELRLVRMRIDQAFKLATVSLEEIFGSTKAGLSARIKSVCKDGNQQRSRKLLFKNKISQPILTGEEIKGEVILVDGCTGAIIDVGPESSSNVEIVALRENCKGEGDELTVDESNDNKTVVQNTKGEKALLTGNTSLKLQRGIGILDNIKFKHCASKVKPSIFRLGARAVDTFAGVCVMEAKSEYFRVKDFRAKYGKKHDTPSLSDEVWRLKNIQKHGNIDTRLQAARIHTVEEFLVQLLINPEELQRTADVGVKKWDVTVNHARETPSAHKMYCYINSEQKKGIGFSLLGQVLGLYFEGCYVPANELSEKHKDDANKLKASALEHWDYIIPCNDENEIQQQFSNLKTEYYTTSGCDNRTIIGESSNRNSNAPLLQHYPPGGCDYMTTLDESSNRNSNAPFLQHYPPGGCDYMTTLGESTNINSNAPFLQHYPPGGCDYMTTLGESTNINSNAPFLQHYPPGGCDYMTTLGESTNINSNAPFLQDYPPCRETFSGTEYHEQYTTADMGNSVDGLWWQRELQQDPLFNDQSMNIEGVIGLTEE